MVRPYPGQVDVTDTRNRALRDLRVSVTDRCNFRCTYCMPREVFGPDHAFVARDELLTFEEIVRVVRAFAAAGVSTIRLTGGEPLLRRDLPSLVAQLGAVEGIQDIAMTTNAALLAAKAQALAEAGLNRVTVSLDALDQDVFEAMTDSRSAVDDVIAGLLAAKAAGLTPIKINAVVRRGINENQIVPLAEFAREHDFTMRFIEYMDVGHSNGWELREVVPADEIVARVGSAFPLEPVAAERASETAMRFRYLDGAGEIGVIASVSTPFCGTCTRARLSPVGEVFTCLFAARGADVRALVRGGADDEELAAFVAALWSRRDDRYSELRATMTPGTAVDGRDRVEMSYIGG